MPEIRGHNLEIIDGRLNDQAIAGIKTGQLVLVDVVNNPKDREVGELYDLHLLQQRNESLDANNVLPTHYPLTLQNAQIEAFLPVAQGVKEAPPIMQVTGRIIDFTVKQKTPARSDDPGKTNYAIADTAHMPAIVKLRQIVSQAKELGYVSQFESLLQGNGDIFCIWEVGTMALKGVVSTTEVGPVDYLEVDAVPDIPAPEKELKRPEDLTYNYEASFTDLESYESENLKELIKPLLNGLRNPDNKYSRAFLHHITRSIFEKDYEIPKREQHRYQSSVDKIMTLLGNTNHPHNAVSQLSTLAHALIRARLLLERIDLQEKEVKDNRLTRKGIPGEPSFKDRKEKVWFELAHALGFENRIHDLNQDYIRLAKLAHPHNVQVFNRLRVQFRSHDDIDAVIAKYADAELRKPGEAHPNASILKTFVDLDFHGQRDSSLNLTILGLAGTQLRVINDVHMGAEMQAKPTDLIPVHSDNHESPYRVLSPPYYPTDVIRAFQSKESSKTFINTVPGVVSQFKVLLPEIEKGLDSRPPLAEQLNREYVVTSAKYQPWAVSEFILQRMYGTKGRYHELRQAIKDGTLSWQSIMEQPRVQSWTLLAEAPIDKNNPNSRRDVVAISQPLYNGDAFLVSTYSNKEKSTVGFDRGTIKGQQKRHRKLGIIARNGLLVSDKKIPRPTYIKQQSAKQNQHQLEVIFAANSVYAKDGVTGEDDQVTVRVPKHWKRVVHKTRKGIKV